MVALRIEEQEASWVKAQADRLADGDRCLIGYPGGHDLWREVDIDDLEAVGEAGLEMADSPPHRPAVERGGQAHVLGADAEEQPLSVFQGILAAGKGHLEVALAR